MKLLSVVFGFYFQSLVLAWSSKELADWEKFKGIYNLSFSCEQDNLYAMSNFVENMETINKHNKFYVNCSSPYFMGMWELGYLTPGQINTMLNGLDAQPFPLVAPKAFTFAGMQLKTPTVENFDWNAEGAVTPVRNQGNCACCYTFGVTGAIEAQIYRKTGSLVKLSDQQLIDCHDPQYRMYGCNMGSALGTYTYIKENGIAAGRSYPYKARDTGDCKYNDTMEAATIKSYRFTRAPSYDYLKSLLYTVGPLTVGVNGSLASFQFYQGGIYDDPECIGGVNHAMLLTGFGTDPKFGPYLILRNSYGKSFGEFGYIKMTTKIPNFCGIWEYISYPEL